MPQSVDVLIITAAEGEDAAVRLVVDGTPDPWEETPGPDGYGFNVWFRTFRTHNGATLRFALTRAHDMGTDAAGNAAARLTDIYKPRCLAMCGVCAGNPKRTKLGDVIVADRVYRYDVGEVVRTQPGGDPVFHADTLTYPFKPQWKQHAQQFTVPPNTPWLQERPRPRELQGLWLLREILEGRDPLASPDRDALCKDWTPVFEELKERAFLKVKGKSVSLTKAGREHIEEELAKYGGELPEQEKWATCVGPLGTGSSLVRDTGIWERLETTQRHIHGLDMEASVIGLTAHVRDVPMIVVKGVMDYAEPGRNQGFRLFAARAAAEVLIGFLRQHLEPSTQSPADILSTNILPPPDATNPATLLNARYGVVPFFDGARQTELAELERWCANDTMTSVRLFVGPGGAGKTRQFIEWARRMRQEGWVAGFAPDPLSAEDADVLVASPEPTLVVIDYAESRPTLLDFLKRVAARTPQAPAKLRVALLAREAADWWLSLHQMDEPVRHLLQLYKPMPLIPVPLEHDLRLQTWERARDTYTAALGKRPPATLLDLTDDRFERVLYLHMSALAAVEGIPASADSLLDEILAHEKQFWLKRFGANHGEDLARADFIGRTARMVAAVTLCGGLPAIEDTEALNERIDGPHEDHFLSFLHSLYPGRAKDAQAGYLAGLEPDLLGEALVIEVLSNANTRRDYLDGVFKDVGEAALQNGFTVLGRIALRHDDATKWLRRVLEQDVPGRARAAFAAAMALGLESALSPLGNVLASALAKAGTPELAAEFAGRIPRETCSLRELAVWTTKTLLDALPKSPNDEETRFERARLCIILGNRLRDLGRREEALSAASEAVDIYRILAPARPNAFLPNLAASLNNLGILLSDLGRREEALAAASEAVEIRRGLAQARPDVFLPNLAASLNNLGKSLSELGRREEALSAASEAVDIYRILAPARPNAFLPNLAASLNNLGNGLSDLGRRKEALAAAREAVDIYRNLAQARPDAFLPDLAMSLNNLGHMLSELGRREEALAAASEAVEIRRGLAQARPDAFLPDLAGSLSNLGNRLSDLGHREEALSAASGAVELYRILAQARPDAFAHDLATSLGVLGTCLHSAQRLEEARDAFAEGVRTLTPRFTALPKAFAPLMARLLAVYMEVSEELHVEPDPGLVLPVAAKLAKLEEEAE